jgi:hypothetical protein
MKKMETAASAYFALTAPEIRKLICRLVWRCLPDLRADHPLGILAMTQPAQPGASVTLSA